jgi:hypothetical protein
MQMTEAFASTVVERASDTYAEKKPAEGAGREAPQEPDQ